MAFAFSPSSAVLPLGAFEWGNIVAEAGGAGMIGRQLNETASMDAQTERAVRGVLLRLLDLYPVQEGILFGSRSRQTHDAGSDADLAVVLKGAPGDRNAAARDMAGIAFDVMLETGVLVEALPLWEDEFNRSDDFGNPVLLQTILRDGLRVRAMT